MMVLFHGCYDATYFGLAHFDMLGSPFWTTWRTLIVTLFVFLSGVSLSLGRTAAAARIDRRHGQLLLAALTVSLVTHLLFGPRWIYFGVLHFYLVASLITRPLLARGISLWLPGVVLLGLGQLGFAAFDPRWLNWIGMAADKPATEDYAPLLPWLGVLWLGSSCGLHPAMARLGRNAPRLRPDRLLQGLGRHGLLVYLIHQPLLFAAFELLLQGTQSAH